MKKLFLLIPAFLLSLAVSAATTNVDPGTGTLSAAIAAASNGDILVLADGTYIETEHVAISKQLTIRAAENATPVVHQNTYRMTVNDEITIIGVTFEAGHSNELLRIATTAADKTITIRNCIFRSAGYGVRVRESECQQLENIVIDNCVFENIEARAIYAEKRTTAAPGITKAISITNSTFAACGKSGSHTPTIEIHDDDENPATAGPVTLIDHCTFYNCSPSQYTIYLYKIGPQATVSNCIVSNPSGEQASTAYHGYDNFNITNCLWYNCSSFGFRTPATSANIINSDPLFADAADGDFSLAGEYGVSMSPARGAGTDGSDLGDPRWYTPVTYPSTGFAAPGYACSADAATIPTGVYGLSLYTESKPHYIICSSVAYNTLLGTWAITATRACYVTVGLDLGPEIDNNKHIFEVKILDKDGNPVGSLSEDPADPTGATENNTEADQLKTIDGSILIPAAGDYTIELRNLRGPGKGSIKNIILTYDGDAPITDFAAPGYTFLAKRAELAGNIEYNTTTATPYIQYTDNSDPGTATWTVTATRACQVKVAMNMVDNSAYSSGNGKHRFVVELLEGNVVKSYVEETSEVDENGRTFPRSYDMPGYITIPAAGDYIIRVRNPRANSRCGLASITLTYSYEGGNVVNIPVAAIPFEDALLHDGATRDGEGLHFMNAQYVEWNIHAAEGLYTFSATCTSSNYSNLTIKVKQGASELYSYTPQYSYNTTDNVISSPQWLLEEGDYTLQLINPTSGNGYVSALSATAAEGYFILNDNKEDDGSIAAANYDASNTTYNILLKRSFTAGRYYTICIPMDFYHSLLESKFGEDYELWRMVSAEQEGDAINLNFEKYVSDGESQNFEPAAGTPFLLKPSVNVENPVFSTKKVRNYTYNNVKSFAAADFVGSFYKDEIPAGENNLYLQNNNLYYSETNDTPIKGTRAWIRLKPQGPNYVKARIVLGPKVVTSINLVNGELLEGAVKTIENGQLVIIRDGVKYNAMGIKLQ